MTYWCADYVVVVVDRQREGGEVSRCLLARFFLKASPCFPAKSVGERRNRFHTTFHIPCDIAVLLNQIEIRCPTDLQDRVFRKLEDRGFHELVDQVFLEQEHLDLDVSRPLVMAILLVLKV